MQGLQEIFTPNNPLSTTKIEFYYKLFKMYPIEDFKRACMSVIATKKISTFPLPAEILEYLDNPEMKANQALERVEKAINRYGYYYSVQFDDPIIHKVIDNMGGWEWISSQKIEDWKWIKKEFLQKYEMFYKQNITNTSDIPDKLIGYHERMNNANGYDMAGKFFVIISEDKNIKSLPNLSKKEITANH